MARHVPNVERSTERRLRALANLASGQQRSSANGELACITYMDTSWPSFTFLIQATRAAIAFAPIVAL
jgi:hypothetical protein